MTDKHKKNRVDWCRANLGRDWSRVLFTDESYFMLYRHKVKLWSRKRPLKPSPKWGPSIMIWCGISSRGTTTLSLTKGSISADRYQDILDENMESMMSCFPMALPFNKTMQVPIPLSPLKNIFRLTIMMFFSGQLAHPISIQLKISGNS